VTWLIGLQPAKPAPQPREPNPNNGPLTRTKECPDTGTARGSWSFNMQNPSSTSLSKRNENSRPPVSIPHFGVRARADEYNAPGSSLSQAWRANQINRQQYEAGLLLVALWQQPGDKERDKRLAAGRALLALSECVARTVVSVCRDNGGLGSQYRALLLRQGLSALAAQSLTAGDATNV
jgi:hypothetical protein